MDRRERTNAKMQELFHTPAAGEEGTDPEFMQILQGYIFGDGTATARPAPWSCSGCRSTPRSRPSTEDTRNTERIDN